MALLDRVIAAMGGVNALRGVKTVVAKQIVTNTTRDAVMNNETTSYIWYPDRFRVEAGTAFGTLVSGYDGTIAWTKDPRGSSTAPREATAEAQSNLDRDVIRLLLAGKDGAMDVRRLPDQKDAQGQLQQALELSGRGLGQVVLLVDPKSFLVTKETFAAGRGGQALVEEMFSGYRSVDGVQMPLAAERRVGPISIKRRVTELYINQPVDPSLFQRPGS
jgi:hypothetical protein